MSRQKGTRRFNVTVFLEAVVVLLLVVIWGNSLLDGDKSSAISGGFTAFLARLFSIDAPDLSHIVRKLAHFSEFAALGFAVSLLLRVLGKRKSGYLMPLALCMMAFPIIDETIQLFTPERGPSVIDIWIDMSGYAFGAVAAFLIFAAVKRSKEKK